MAPQRHKESQFFPQGCSLQLRLLACTQQGSLGLSLDATGKMSLPRARYSLF
jgi:hypothetical protein